ncbi:MAG: TetR family transcriptional regulator, partial [Nocardioides sp.]|nr:TetR family transcriptional regulator [Nocardioides sp.]
GDGRDRGHAATRARIVADTPALKERELLKMATLTTTATEALAARGVAEPAATLAAHTAIAVFQTAFARWVSGEHEQSFVECCDQAAAALRGLM